MLRKKNFGNDVQRKQPLETWPALGHVVTKVRMAQAFFAWTCRADDSFTIRTTTGPEDFEININQLSSKVQKQSISSEQMLKAGQGYHNNQAAEAE